MLVRLVAGKHAANFGGRMVRLLSASSVAPQQQRLLKCSSASEIEEIALQPNFNDHASNITTAIKMLKQFDHNNNHAVLDRVLMQAERLKFASNEIAEMCANLSTRAPSFILKQAEEQANLKHFTGPQFVSILTHLDKLQDQTLLGKIAQEIARRKVLLDTFAVEDLIQILGKFKSLDHKSIALCEKVADEIFVLEDFKELRAGDYVTLVDAFAAWDFRDNDLFDRIEEELTQKRVNLDDFKDKDFYTIMDGLMSLGYESEDLSAKFSSEMEARVTRAFFRKWNKVVYAVVGVGAVYIVSPLALSYI